MAKNKESQEQDKRRRHIKEMEAQLSRLTGQSDSVFISSDCSLEMHEKFLEHILAFERTSEQPLFDYLKKNGVQLPPPKTLDDTQLQAKLWEVVNAMALLGHYLSSTDHLSDRQLYEILWTDILREPTTICPNDPNAAWHIDILGGCSDEDLQIRLKYYMDEDDRQDWANSYPEDEIPPHEALPYDRDRHLPAPPDVYTPVRRVC